MVSFYTLRIFSLFLDHYVKRMIQLVLQYSSISYHNQDLLIEQYILLNWLFHPHWRQIYTPVQLKFCSLQLLLYAFLATTLECYISLQVLLMMCFVLVTQQEHLPMPFDSSASLVF